MWYIHLYDFSFDYAIILTMPLHSQSMHNIGTLCSVSHNGFINLPLSFLFRTKGYDEWISFFKVDQKYRIEF